MSKIELEFELTGLKIRIKGDRSDVPQIASNLGEQVSGLLQPAANIATGEEPTKKIANTAQSPQYVEPKPSKKRPRTRSSNSAPKEPAVDWSHNAAEWGNPQQEWNPTKKAIWLLYVVRNVADVREMTASRIATTFNKHFRETRQIRPSNVSRDLLKAKSDTPSPVQNDTGQDPNTWYLTEAGLKLGQQYVNEARGLAGTVND